MKVDVLLIAVVGATNLLACKNSLILLSNEVAVDTQHVTVLATPAPKNNQLNILSSHDDYPKAVTYQSVASLATKR